MKPLYASYIMISLLSISITGMDDDDDNKEKTSKKKDARISIEVERTHIPHINTLEQLRQSSTTYVKKEENGPEHEKPQVAPTIAATIAATVAYKKDPCNKSGTLKQLKSTLEELKKNNPEQYNELEKDILILNRHYNNNISEAGIKEHKKNQHTPPTSSSSSTIDSLKGKVVKTLLQNQSALSQEVEHQQKELDDFRIEAKKIKKKMRQLTLQAAEDAQKEEEKRAKRNMYVGLGGTIGAAVITAIATYYGAIAAVSGNSSSPKCVNGTL